MPYHTSPTLALSFWLTLATLSSYSAAQQTEPVSFSRDVRPVLQAKCIGCHQGANKQGGYLMTSFEQLLSGGESGSPAIVPGKPEKSYLVEQISIVDSEAAMPPEGEPLSDAEFQLIVNWIKSGAVNDALPRQTFDVDNPPQYTRLPVITSLAFSRDGELLASSGVSEVVLVNAHNQQLVARLIGMSPRIESIEFSPDGKYLAVAGGRPGEFGELQVWDVRNQQQVLSKVMTHDTIFGVSWSPSGKTIAFGCADTAVRAIDLESGEQVLYQNAHEDWVRDTVFSADGSHLVSVGRDMTCKLTEVAEQRFVDNVTSITPGVLKGGISSIAKHPQRDEILIGGADGIPKFYRLFRQTKRVIGDDANLIRRMPPQGGRIQSVSVSPDGRRAAAGSSLDGNGSVFVYSYEFDTKLPDDVKAIMRKVVSQRNAEEKKKLEAYVTRDIRIVSQCEFPSTGIYAVTFDPSGNRLAAGGSDGRVAIIETETGKIQSSFAPVALIDSTEIHHDQPVWRFPVSADQLDNDNPARDDQPIHIKSLQVLPEKIEFRSAADYVQLVVQGETPDGQFVDLTHSAKLNFDSSLVEVTKGRIVQPLSVGKSELSVEYGDIAARVAVSAQFATDREIDFARDIQPVLSRLGCNAGTCHGSASGKNGFQLSLRGYDPLFDVRALTDDLSSRRVNVALPDESLMLLKSTAQVPHQGGQVIKPGSKYYSLIHQWITAGAKYENRIKHVVGIDVQPPNPVLEQIGSQQQLRVVATLADGSQRDVSREAFIESANTEAAEVNKFGLVTAMRRGESAILARYEGSFSATTLTVMDDRPGFQWTEPDKFNRIDELVATKWRRMKIIPSRLTDDYEFLRRIHLDLTGLPPTADEVRAFVQIKGDTETKRNDVINQLIGSNEFVDHWTNKWADLLQVNRKFLGPQGASSFRDWIRKQVKNNVPYDKFVKQLITANGSNKQNPAAAYFKILRKPDLIMENTTHLFLATRFNCNKCHDHPFERWTQDQYYETAAFFAHVGLKKDPESKDKKIAGTAVEGATPLFEIIYEQTQGQVIHERTGKITEPQFPFDCQFERVDGQTRREQFAAWLTSRDNPYFAKSYVNRLWGYMLGTGLIEPIDDIRASNPPTNPELLEFLTAQFIDSGFDVQHVIRLICQSRTYQLSIASHEFNADDHVNFSHAKARRLPAEVLFDAIHFSLGSQSKIPGFEPGTRAVSLPDAGAKLPSGFLATLGRPPRESVCECDRSNELQLGSVLALVSGPDQARAINDPTSAIAKLVVRTNDDQRLIDEVFMRVLNRPPSQKEVQAALDSFEQIGQDHQLLLATHDQRSKLVAERLPDIERQRESAIAQAEQDLNQFLQKTDPGLLAREKTRNEKIAKAQSELDAYNRNLESRFEQWRDEQLTRNQWYPLIPASISQSSGARYEVLVDRSIRVLENKGKTVTEVIAETELSGISAIRLEVLADDKLPGGGPGLAKNGNFVLTEFTLELASRARPEEWKPVKISSAIADFDQQDYPIVRAIDGNLGSGNSQGWAISPQLKKSHWGVFELQLPIGFKSGSRLRLKLHQNYGFDNLHQVGRFRISVMQSDQPVGLTVSEELLTKLIENPDSWPKPQRDSLMAIFKKGDSRLIAINQNLNVAKKPIDIDPGIDSRRAKLARVSRPIPPDPELTQLRSDVEHSERQLSNRRLTAAQDLVWALVNSPSFLFNR